MENKINSGMELQQDSRREKWKLLEKVWVGGCRNLSKTTVCCEVRIKLKVDSGTTNDKSECVEEDEG